MEAARNKLDPEQLAAAEEMDAEDNSRSPGYRPESRDVTPASPALRLRCAPRPEQRPPPSPRRSRQRRRADAMAERVNPNMLFANFNQDFT